MKIDMYKISEHTNLDHFEVYFWNLEWSKFITFHSKIIATFTVQQY